MKQRAQPHGNRNLAWRVPRWSAVRQQKKILAQIIGVRPLARAVLFTFLAGACVSTFARYWYPDMPLNFMPKMFAAFVTMYLFLGGFLVLQIWWPDHIQINETRIVHTLWSVAISDIGAAYLVNASPEIMQLTVRSKRATHRVAVPQFVDLQRLLDILPTLELRDRQSEFRIARMICCSRHAPRKTG